MRKRIFLAVALAMTLLVSAVGCGGKEEPQEPVESTEEVKEEEVKEEKEEEPELDANLTVHENTFFKVGYDEKEGWILPEDEVYVGEDGGSAEFLIMNGDDEIEVLVEIEAYEDDHHTFRDRLHYYEFDQKAYVDGSLETTDIGGQPMLMADDGYGETIFFGRNEDAGVSYKIIADSYDDARVAALVDNIICTASGTGNVDAPWYWEGEAFSGDTKSQMVGTYTLTAEFLPMDEPLITYEVFEHDIAAIDDQVYLLSAYQLYQYNNNGDSLSFGKEIPLDTEYDTLETGANGELVLSKFMKPVIGHDGDSVLYSYEGPETFTVAPDGTWGISWFYSAEDCQKYTFGDGALTGEAFPFAEVDGISHLSIDDNYILISGTGFEDDDHHLFVYDHSGNFKMKLDGEPDSFGLGSITFATSTPNGFLALDGNMREVVLWSSDGTWIGAADDSDLFGTNYPWFAAADVAEDGSIYIVMSDERTDESAEEVLVFKLSGF